jgi:hypothetical protein
MFLCGYPRETKGFYFYNKAEGKVFVARNGVFMEKEFLSKGVSRSKVQLEEIQETPKNILAPTDPIHEVQDVILQELKHQPHVGLQGHIVQLKSSHS